VGVPDDHVRALKHLNDMRTTRLTINGATSAEIPYRKGSPQGDPISPDVFNLMVQTLSNKLRASTILRGVKFSSPTTATSNAEAIVRFLWYADDLIVIGTSRAEIEEAARILDCPAGTVKSRCSRGRSKLAKRLEYLRNPNIDEPVQDPEGGHGA
jgi:hypothetical protein